MREKIQIPFLTVVAFFVLSGMLFAQRGTISGTVIDANTGEPLPGASVLVEGLELGAATNVEGEYSIANIPAGARKVIARFIGYKSVKQTVNVTGGSTIEVDFELHETVLQLDEVVVTGAGVASEKKRLGNTVATINTSQKVLLASRVSILKSSNQR